MPNRMDDALWKAYRAGYIQAASEYGGPEYERTVAEAEAHACKYAEVHVAPTPALTHEHLRFLRILDDVNRLDDDDHEKLRAIANILAASLTYL